MHGRSAESLHDFYCSYIRYATHLYAYFFLAANPYPGFTGKPGYPIDVELPPLERQSRWKTLFRLILAFPALALSAVLVGRRGPGRRGRGGGGGSDFEENDWLFARRRGRVRGRVPRVVRLHGARPDAARVPRPRGVRAPLQRADLAYVLLVTDRYPTADPGGAAGRAAPPSSPPCGSASRTTCAARA